MADAGTVARDLTPTPLKLLLSYHYFKNEDRHKHLSQFGDVLPEVFIDSGAFSAWSQGVPIALGEYQDFLERWRDVTHVAAGLDVIGDGDASARNWRASVSDGFDVLPTFHVGEDWKLLDEYTEATDYVALGGMVGVPTPKVMRWAIQCFKRARDRHGEHAIRFHGFGLTRKETMQLPWYSVDSTSWLAGCMFGAVVVFDRSTGWFQKVDATDRTGLMNLDSLLKDHHSRWWWFFVDGSRPTPVQGLWLARLGALSYTKYEHAVARSRLYLAGVPPTGFKLYLACALGDLHRSRLGGRSLSRDGDNLFMPIVDENDVREVAELGRLRASFAEIRKATT